MAEKRQLQTRSQQQQSGPHIQRRAIPSTHETESTSHLSQHESGISSPVSSQNRGSTPPPYSGPSNVVMPSTYSHSEFTANDSASPRGGENLRKHPGLPRLDYKLYSPPLFKLSSDCTTLSSKAEYLSTNASALTDLIRAHSTVPPKPVIQIRGTRGRKVDFDIRLNLMSLLVPDDERQRMDYIRCAADGELVFRGGVKPDTKPHLEEAGLEEWCQKFVKDNSSVKSFALDRVVANLDLGWIEGQLRSLIASPLNYKGAVDVIFTTTHAKVVVQNPDKVNGFFTSVTTLFSGKNKYEVVKAVWPFATTKGGQPGRRCIVQSEETWWREWRDPIRHAIASKRMGWVTVEDKLEALMEPMAGGEEEVDWGYAD